MKSNVQESRAAKQFAAHPTLQVLEDRLVPFGGFDSPNSLPSYTLPTDFYPQFGSTPSFDFGKLAQQTGDTVLILSARVLDIVEDLRSGRNGFARPVIDEYRMPRVNDYRPSEVDRNILKELLDSLQEQINRHLAEYLRQHKIISDRGGPRLGQFGPIMTLFTDKIKDTWGAFVQSFRNQVLIVNFDRNELSTALRFASTSYSSNGLTFFSADGTRQEFQLNASGAFTFAGREWKIDKRFSGLTTETGLQNFTYVSSDNQVIIGVAGTEIRQGSVRFLQDMRTNLVKSGYPLLIAATNPLNIQSPSKFSNMLKSLNPFTVQHAELCLLVDQVAKAYPQAKITVAAHSKAVDLAAVAAVLVKPEIKVIGLNGSGTSELTLTQLRLTLGADTIQSRIGRISNYNIAGDFVNIINGVDPFNGQLGAQYYFSGSSANISGPFGPLVGVVSESIARHDLNNFTSAISSGSPLFRSYR